MDRWTTKQKSELSKIKRKAKREGWLHWIRNHRDEHALLTGHWFDVKEAERFRKFVETCVCYPAGRGLVGKPFRLVPWQHDDFFGPLLSWKRADGKRRFDRGYVSCAKKNSKTTCAALLLLYLAFFDGEPSAFVASASTSRDNAAQIYNTLARIVRVSPQLKATLDDPLDSTKTVTHLASGSKYWALCSESHSVEGYDLSACVIDELHAHRTPDLFNALRYAGSAREQPICPLSITTAGVDADSICRQQYEYAKKVIDGCDEGGTPFYDDSFFALIYEAAPDDDPDDPKTWRKANPSLGTLIDEAKFRREWHEAKATPTAWNQWLRYRLNRWVQNDTTFFNMERWDECIAKIDPAELIGRECYCGLDLSSRIATTSVCLLFPQLEDGELLRHDVLHFFWVPEEGAVEWERTHEVPLLTWARQGKIPGVRPSYVELIPGNSIDQRTIRRRINELGDVFKIKTIATDRWESNKIITELMDEDGFDVVLHGMGYQSISNPMKDLEALVLDNKLNHFGNPVLRWQAGCTSVETDHRGNLRPITKREKERKDGIDAMLLALSLASMPTSDAAERWDGKVEFF